MVFEMLQSGEKWVRWSGVPVGFIVLATAQARRLGAAANERLLSMAARKILCRRKLLHRSEHVQWLWLLQRLDFALAMGFATMIR